MIESMTVPDEITTNPAWRRAVERANEWIAGELGRWTAGKRFTWKVDSAADPHLFDLLIETETGAVSERFDWYALNNEERFLEQINALWSDLIQQDMYAGLEDLKQLRAEWAKEDAVAAKN